ncbi:unannotated protein [freshwater metagenome]|uniref:Unannotated protein n=1 Tax=freshwater metagenome TaxID=449393 RepID=A0A6J7HPJ1_9ZZZZ|nr:endonuclease/exonuclease/phosphatase family protein [Actinomycetota bacterium]
MRRWASTAGALAVLGLLLAALVLAWLRVTDPTSRRLVEAVSLTPLGVPLAALALALAGTARWLAPRPVRLAAVVAAAGLLLAHCWWLAPLYTGSLRAGGPASVVVLAQNFEYGDADALVELVRREDVDVLVLTDAGNGRVDDLLAAGIEAQLPHTAGVGTEGAVVLSRLPLAWTRRLYPDSESRLVGLEVVGIGELTVAAVHTAPPYRPDGWRADHAEVLAALAPLASGPGSALVLAGDLNATPAHAPVRRLVDLGLADAAAQVNAGWSPTWPAGGRERRLGVPVPAFAAIDHVLTSPRLVVTAYDTVELAGADHRGVLARISVAASGSG